MPKVKIIGVPKMANGGPGPGDALRQLINFANRNKLVSGVTVPIQSKDEDRKQAVLNAVKQGRVLQASNIRTDEKVKGNIRKLNQQIKQQALLDKKQKEAEAAERQAARDFNERKTKTFTFPTGETKTYEQMTPREKWYIAGKSLENKGAIGDENSLFNEYINPLTIFTNMAGALGEAPYVAKQTDSYLPYITAIGSPLLMGRMMGSGSINPFGKKFWTNEVSNAEFLNNMALGVPGMVKGAGNKLAQSMESGLLSNTYKLNPWRFKANPEAYYRHIGESGFADALESGVVRANPKGSAFGTIHDNAYYNLGKPNDFFKSPFGNQHIAEVSGDNSLFKVIPPEVQGNPTYAYTPKNISIDNPNLKFYKQDWLRGYKEVPKPRSISSSLENITPSVQQPWTMQELPGLHIKSTMTGSPLEKQLSKTGQIDVNNIRAHIGKADVGSQDKFIIDKVLNEKFAGQKKIDYNDFRNAVSNELIPLNRTEIPNFEHANWGLDRLGYTGPKLKSVNSAIKATEENIASLEKQLNNWKNTDDVVGYEQLKNELAEAKSKLLENQKLLENVPLENRTFTFSNAEKFGRGDAKHFTDESTLGHTRTLVSREEPHISHVLESQSDFYQNEGRTTLEKLKGLKEKDAGSFQKRMEAANRQLKNLEESKKSLEDLEYRYKNNLPDEYGHPIHESTINEFKYRIRTNEETLNLRKAELENWQQKFHLGKAHQERFLQENIRQAVENGQTTMRYPTSETAAKIQGYVKQPTIEIPGIGTQEGGYEAAHQTILKKYNEAPKMIKKTIGVEPKLVTDPKGNTWYEFDIPESFKKGKGEIKAFKQGGVIKGAMSKMQGGGEEGILYPGTPDYFGVYGAINKKGDYPKERQAVINQLSNLPIYSPDKRSMDYQNNISDWKRNVENIPIYSGNKTPHPGSSYYGYGAPLLAATKPYEGTIQLDPRQFDRVQTPQRVIEHEIRHAAFDGRNFIPQWYGDALYNTARKPEEFDRGAHENLLNERAVMTLGTRQAMLDRFGLKPNAKIPRELFDAYNREMFETGMRSRKPINQFSDYEQTFKGARNASDVYDLINFEDVKATTPFYEDAIANKKYGGPGDELTPMMQSFEDGGDKRKKNKKRYKPGSILYKDLYNEGRIGSFDKEGRYAGSHMTLPEVVVYPKDKDTKKFYDALSDDEQYAFDQMTKKYGPVNITTNEAKGIFSGTAGHYNPFANKITINTDKRVDPLLAYLSELSHKVQFDKQGKFDVIGDWVFNDLPAYVKRGYYNIKNKLNIGDRDKNIENEVNASPYVDPSTVEHEAHAYYQPKLENEFVDYYYDSRLGRNYNKYKLGGNAKCPKGQVWDEGRQKCVTILSPIYTDDPRKVRAYNDSLTLNKFSTTEDNLISNARNAADVDNAISNDPEYVNAYYRLKELNHKNPSGKHKVPPVTGSNLWSYTVFTKPIQPYILQKEPILKRKYTKQEPISISRTFNPRVTPLNMTGVNLPPVQQGNYRVEYFDPSLGEETHRRFMTQAESDAFANELSNRNLNGIPAAGNITQRVEYSKGGQANKYFYNKGYGVPYKWGGPTRMNKFGYLVDKKGMGGDISIPTLPDTRGPLLQFYYDKL